MKYANIKYNDVANGFGVRTSLFVSGCRLHCKGCFNQSAWNFRFGREFTDEVIQQILDSIDNSHTQGLSLLGGDPMDKSNQKGILPLVRAFRDRFPNGEKDLWCWTGFVYDEDLLPGQRGYSKYTDELLHSFDVLVDGPWIEELYSITIRFRGSTNQRVINMPETLKTGKIVTINVDEGMADLRK